MAGSKRNNGMDQLIRELRKMGKDVQREVKEEIYETAQLISVQAESAGRIPASLTSKKGESVTERLTVITAPYNNGFSVAVIVDPGGGLGNFPAYVEFGTGIDAAAYVPTLPKEWQAIAKSYYVNGKGKIKKRPFLYPAYFKNIPILEKNLKNIIKRERKK